MLGSVLTTAKLDKTLTYTSEEALEAGQVVAVPLRNKPVLGIVAERFSAAEPPEAEQDFPKERAQQSSSLPKAASSSGPLQEKLFAELPFVNPTPSARPRRIAPPSYKAILQAFPESLSVPSLAFLDWVAAYNLIDRGTVLKMMLPFAPEELAKPDATRAILPLLTRPHLEALSLRLTPEQEAAAEVLQARDHFAVDLIDGVTGSGKTELYFAVMARRLLQGPRCQALILLPEIALTVSLVERFERYFGLKPCLWHSNMARGQKLQIWRRAIRGEPLIVIGARSALFLPFKSLAQIIIDEEHDPSYKQNERGIYQARDMGILRGKLEGAPVILVSATPSLETIQNVRTGKYGCVKLPSRFAKATLPEVIPVDMRQEVGAPVLSEPLVEAMEAALLRGEQTLLFINQRGYAPVSVCRKCGHHWRCPRCDVHVIEHRGAKGGAGGFLLCHYCDYREPLPEACPACGAEKSRLALGMGTERVLEAVRHRFPQARAEALSSDTVASKSAWAQALEAIGSGKVDVILGTQILAKGHHFPLLTTVGVIEADQNAGGLRANERTYQLLDQVAGRAGRGARKGRVFLQTYAPESPLLQALCRHDRDAFYAYELEDRQRHGMPPFANLIAVIVTGREELEAQKAAAVLARTFPLQGPEAVLLGPAPAPLAKLRGMYRYRLLIKASKAVRVQRALKTWSQTALKRVGVTIDVDPYEFL